MLYGTIPFYSFNSRFVWMIVDCDIPEKLIEPIFFSKKKHRIIKGGRGGAKSESVARAILTFSIFFIGHTLCTRSVQNSIKDSVYSVIVRLIKKQKLEGLFEIKINEIVCRRNGNKIIFKGCNALSDPKSEAAKGLDEIRYCWFEEAHTATENDIDILIPSVRAKDAVFFWTYNSNKEPCIIQEYFQDHSNAEFTEIHYYENPFLPETLLEEAEECKRLNYDKYKEIWLGQRSTDSSKNVLILDWIEAAIKLYEPDSDGRIVFGLDLADEGEDKSALVMRKGLAIESAEEWDYGDVVDSTRKAYQIMRRYDKPHCIFDRVGIGAAAKATLKKESPDIKTTAHSNGDSVENPNKEYVDMGVKTGIKNKDMFGGLGPQQWFEVRTLFYNAWRKLRGEEVDEYVTINPDIKNLKKLKKELLQIEFETNNKGQVMIVKAPKGTKSPNLADALQMCLRKPKILSKPIV